MSIPVPTKTQVYQVIDQLSPSQLAQLWEYVQRLTREPVAPLYHVHERAIATGVVDLAAQHDYYLYSQSQRTVQAPFIDQVPDDA
jgi:hypothetical protein